MIVEHDPSVAPRGIDRRTVLTAAAWATPVLAVAVATPLAAASGSNVQAASLTNTTSLPAQGGQITFTRPLALSITGSMRAGELITLTLGGTMTPVAGPTRATPLRIASAAGPNFSQVSTSTGPGGQQITVLMTNRELAEGTYTKTINWIPLDGVTTAEMETGILGWTPGTYTTSVAITVGTVTGTSGLLTITREPEN